MKKVILIWRMQWKDKDDIKSSDSMHSANSIHSAKKPSIVLSIKTRFMLIQKVVNKKRKTKGDVSKCGEDNFNHLYISK